VTELELDKGYTKARIIIEIAVSVRTCVPHTVDLLLTKVIEVIAVRLAV